MRKRLRIPARCWAAFAAVCGALSCQASVFPPATATRECNALNAIVRLEDSGGRVTQWHYDRAGRAVALGLPNGQQQDNEYDAAGRLTARTLYAPPGSANPGTEDPAGILAAFGWQHDAAGNVIAQIELWPGGGASGRVGLNPRLTEMSYDDAGHLTREKVTDPNASATVTITDYTYDSAYNRATRTVTEDGAVRKSTAYTHNAANQLTSWTEQNGGGTVMRSATLGYDSRGNRANQAVTTTEAGGNTTGAPAQNTAYQWDHQNRLVGVTAPDGGQHSYRYDYRTRRIGRDEPGPGATAITYTGGLALAEYPVSSILDPVPSPAQPAVEYRRGPDMGGGIGGLLYSLRGGQAKFNLSNGRGDIVAQSDAGAQVTWTASYEAFGKRPVESGHNADRQRANTKEEDPTGLLHEHFRYRDLETGVWLSRDPAGFVDGPNLYCYVRQNPWSRFDPLGLAGTGMGYAWSGTHSITGKPEGANYFNSDEFRQGFNESAVIGFAVPVAITVAAPVAIKLGVAGVVKEVASEVVDNAVEKSTGIPLPATPITGLAKDGLKKLGKEGAEAGVETALDVSKAAPAAQMGEELADQIGKNRVSVKTSGDRQLDIDLRGKSHFDKKTNTDVPTPHVKESKLVTGNNGKVNVDKKSQTTRPATKQDVRTARKVVERRAKDEGK